MPIDFPSSPSSGQRYDYLSKSWIWNDVYWASVGSSGNISSGQLGTPVLFSGNIASGSIGSFHFASGVVVIMVVFVNFQEETQHMFVLENIQEL